MLKTKLSTVKHNLEFVKVNSLPIHGYWMILIKSHLFEVLEPVHSKSERCNINLCAMEVIFMLVISLITTVAMTMARDFVINKLIRLVAQYISFKIINKAIEGSTITIGLF